MSEILNTADQRYRPIVDASEDGGLWEVEVCKGCDERVESDLHW
ncbi:MULTISPECIES: hypothetical protein [unclassified Endozoicomonas]|nr:MULTISPECIES: hypothetical protein [unclassified Endozoicomonas]